MKIIFTILCFLWFSIAHAKEHVIEPQVPEVNEIINWIPEEVPRTVSFYIDTNRDNLVDVIITYSLIEAYACKENCVFMIEGYRRPFSCKTLRKSHFEFKLNWLSNLTSFLFNTNVYKNIMFG